MKEEIAELIESVEKNSNKVHEVLTYCIIYLYYLEANDIKIEDVMKELEKKEKNELR